MTSGQPCYYTTGSTDVAEFTPVTIQRLERRRVLTKNSNRLVIALVGLPARGKSFVARKIENYMNWSGCKCRIFNVGKYRRQAYALLQKSNRSDAERTERDERGACDANFFDANNKQAAELREAVAEAALVDMLSWLDDDEDFSDAEDDTRLLSNDRWSRQSSFESNSTLPGTSPKLNFKRMDRVAIFDATNSTNKRRQWVLERCTSREKPTGVVFVESICNDQELLEENYRYKISNSPDFGGMSQEEAIADLRDRVRKYEEQYETVADDSMSYIKIYNLSTKLLMNHIYGRMAKELVPALMSWHIGTRPIFLCRPGQTMRGITTDGEDYVARNKIDPSDPCFLDMSGSTKRKSYRGDTVGASGVQFRSKLLDFVYEETQVWLLKRASVHDMAATGTSISGLDDHHNLVEHVRSSDGDGWSANQGTASMDNKEPFPLRILTSTMPRATDTVNWSEFQFQINQTSNLNPLDKGDFAGMELEEIRLSNPAWYAKLEKDPFGTRFPGGESYRDLVRRLTSVVIDIEQQVIPTLVVSHVSILQCLMAYFRNTPVEHCMSLDVPMHTVIEYTPVRGGGFSETRHCLDETVLAAASTAAANAALSARLPSMQSIASIASEISQLSGTIGSEDVSWPPIWGDGMPTSPVRRPLYSKRGLTA